jgi:hypothetical protein
MVRDDLQMRLGLGLGKMNLPACEYGTQMCMKVK